jgi:dUTP pyrophosphatase
MDIKVVCDDEKYLPQYANDTDACMDLKVVVPKGEFVLCPGHSKMFKTGIKVSVPENHVMMMFLRSSAGIKGKLTLMNGTGIIDSGYRDEVKLAIKNNSDNQSYIFKDGERIAQFMIIPRPKLNLIQVPDNEEFKQGNRGGGIGSTGSIEFTNAILKG